MSFKFDHLHLRTANVKETIAFYTANFDAELVNDKRADGGAEINIDGTMILLSPLPSDQRSVLPEPGIALDHFAFRVPDLESVIPRLKSNGVVFAAEMRVAPTGVKVAFITGPDGVKIELMQR